MLNGLAKCQARCNQASANHDKHNRDQVTLGLDHGGRPRRHNLGSAGRAGQALGVPLGEAGPAERMTAGQLCRLHHAVEADMALFHGIALISLPFF